MSNFQYIEFKLYNEDKEKLLEGLYDAAELCDHMGAASDAIRFFISLLEDEWE